MAGRQVVIARRATFALPTRLHTFVLVGLFKADAGRDHLDRFVEEAALYARTVRGGLPVGARRATSTVAVAVVASAADAGGWADQPVGADAVPVLVDLEEGRVRVPRADSRVAALVREHVAPALDLPPS